MNLSLESEPTVGDLVAIRSARADTGRSEERGEDETFRLMAESVESVAFFLLSPEGLVSSWNPGATRIEGYQREEILGRHFSVFYPPEAQASGLPERELAMAHGQGRCETEGWRVRKDGSRLLANVSLAALRGRDGHLFGYSNVTRDLTETRAAEEKLRRAYERLNAVMDSSSDGIMQISYDWTILYGNRKAIERLLDFKLGGHLWDCFPALLGTHVERTLRRAMRDRVNTVYDNHYAPYNMWYRSRAFPSEDGISIFFTDITSQKTLEEQLALEQILREKRIEALSQMAGDLAHEINNPLAIIHARASDLGAVAASDLPVAAAAVRAACHSIVHTSDRAIRVLRALQGFAREAGTDPMQLTPPLEMLVQCLDLLEDRFNRHGVEFRVNLAPDLPDVLCREVQIRQIVTNLLNNALDAVQHSGVAERWVALTASNCEDGLRVEVSDSGPGIEEELRRHLMNPFFADKIRGMGMGVGLSLSRSIAQEHGGSLVLAEATAHTTFRLTLPLPKRHGSVADVAQSFVSSTEGGRQRC